jgi:hypothetical protein
MKHLLLLAALFVGTYVTASAQCPGSLSYKIDNQTSCTYTVVIDYVTCSFANATTSPITARSLSATWTNIPFCHHVTHVRVYDAQGLGDDANITNSFLTDDVGDCNTGTTTDTAEWIDPQTTAIY